MKAKSITERIDLNKLELFLKAVNGDSRALNSLSKLSNIRLDKMVKEGLISDPNNHVEMVVKRFKEALKDEVIGHILINYFSRFSPKLIALGKRLTPRSIIMLGAPGIGKSERVFQSGELITDVLNILFKDDEPVLRFAKLTTENAEEIIANPNNYFIVGDIRLVYYTDPAEIRGIPQRKILADKRMIITDIPTVFTSTFSSVPGIMFLDELTNADEQTINASFQILLDHMIGFTKLHDDVIVVGAGNTKEYSRSAGYLPKPILTRADVKIIKPPRLEDWENYMMRTYGDGWDKIVYNYLLYKAIELDKDPPISQDGFIMDADTFQQLKNKQEAYNCPRSWTEFAVRLKNLSDIYNTDVLKIVLRMRKKIAELTKASEGKDISSKSVIDQLKDDPEFHIYNTVDGILRSIIGERAYESFLDFIEGSIRITSMVRELYEYNRPIIENKQLHDKIFEALKDYQSILLLAMYSGELYTSAMLTSKEENFLKNVIYIFKKLCEMDSKNEQYVHDAINLLNVIVKRKKNTPHAYKYSEIMATLEKISPKIRELIEKSTKEFRESANILVEVR